MTRIIDMEVSVPRFDVGDDQAHTEPGRGAPAVDTERPAGYGMANYARIFKARQEGADHRPASELDTFMEMLGKLGVERALPFGVDNDEIAELLRRYPGRILGLARISAFKGMSGVRELERRVRDEGFHALGVSALVDGIPATTPDGQGQGSSISLTSLALIFSLIFVWSLTSLVGSMDVTSCLKSLPSVCL